MRVVVKSIAGHMGREIAYAIAGHPNMTLMCGISSGATESIISLPGPGGTLAEIPCYATLYEALRHHEADSYVDFSHASQAVSCIDLAFSYGLRVLTGTTGIPEATLARLGQKAASRKLALLYSPNFALGAVIMIQAAKLAARYLAEVEIVELHHAGKADSPSGTAIHTADAISKARPQKDDRTGLPPTPSAPRPWMPLPPNAEPSRGVTVSGVRIHSVRLPGLVAHQEVIFGGLDETLLLRHDSLSRKSFLPGILLGLERLPTCTGLVRGLEELLQ